MTGRRRPAVSRALWPGLVAWFVLGVVFAVLDQTGLVSGLAVSLPLLAAFVVARALDAGAVGFRVAAALAGLVAASCFVFAAAVWWFGIETGDFSPGQAAPILLATAVVSGALAGRRSREALMRRLGLDPESWVHAVGVLSFTLTLLLGVGDFARLQGQPAAVVPLDPSDPVSAVLGDGALALAGVGFALTRGPRATAARLGLRPLGWRQVAWMPIVAALFHVVVAAMEYAESVLSPGLYALEHRFPYEFVSMPPVLGAFLVSLAVGVGEEILFRGALQPRAGIVLASLLFAVAHSQYQVPGMLVIFMIGVGLGLLRERTSTSFAIGVHALYDFGAFVLDF